MTRSEVEAVAEEVAARIEEAIDPTSLPYPAWVEGLAAAEDAKRRLREAEARAAAPVARKLSGRTVPVPQYSPSGEYMGTSWLPAEYVTIAGRPALEVIRERESRAAAAKTVESDRPKTKLVLRRGGWARVPA